MNALRHGRSAAILAVTLMILGGTALADNKLDISQKDVEIVEALSRVSRALVQKVEPCVVYVETQEATPEVDEEPPRKEIPEDLKRMLPEWFRRRYEQQQQQQQGRPFKMLPRKGLGSGFIISKDGWIVTNDHVVKDAKKVLVQLYEDDTKYPAEIVRRDPKSELALIKIKVDRELPTLTFGDSGSLQVGDWVMAFGNPLGLEHTVSRGIVSAKDRQGVMPRMTDRPAILYEKFIQTDAAINRGNSGGPLVNLHGEVVGINTLIATPYNIGIGFAIPSEIAKRVVDELMSTGHVRRGWLGITMQPLDPGVREYLKLGDREGILVESVRPDNPAAKGGIEPYDVLLDYDGKPVDEITDFQLLVANTPPGKTVPIVVWRDGKEATKDVAVGEQPGGPVITAAGYETDKLTVLGMTVENLTAANSRNFGFEPDRGVVITSVDADGPAFAADLRPGMAIVEVNRKKVKDAGDLKEAVDETPEGGMVLLRMATPTGREFIRAIKKPGDEQK